MPQPNPGPAETTPVSPWWAMTGIGLGVFMATIDFSIVNISLPTLMHDLDASLATIEWVVVSYALVVTSLMLGVARLGDMIGKRRIYLAGLAVFSLGSLLCALAPGVYWLIGFRGLQGVGAVMMQALGMGIITEAFPASMRGRALGIMGGVVSLGLAAGPPLGGLLIALAGWRAVFWVNVPLGLIAWLVVMRMVPETGRPAGGQRFDPAGALILFATLICYALGMTLGQQVGFGQAGVVALLVLTAAGAVGFVRLQARLAQPMMDLSLFKNPLFGLNLLMGYLSFLLLGGSFVLPLYLEVVEHYSPEQTGLLMMVVPVCMGAVSPWAGSLSDRYGSRSISLVGMVVLALGCWALTTLHAGVSLMGYLLRVAPLGLGMGLFQSPNNSAIMGAAPRHRLGVASGLVALSRTLGNTSGVPLMGAFFAAQALALAGLPDHGDLLSAPPAALAGGVAGTFGVATAVALVGVGLAAAAVWLDRRRGDGDPPGHTRRVRRFGKYWGKGEQPNAGPE